MVIALIIFILTLAGKLFVDLRLYFSGKANKHRLGPAIVLVALIACSWLGGWRSAPMWFFSYWIIFDSAYAIMIGQKWNYIGTTSFLDKLQRKYEGLVIVKYSLTFASIAFYFITR